MFATHTDRFLKAHLRERVSVSPVLIVAAFDRPLTRLAHSPTSQWYAWRKAGLRRLKNARCLLKTWGRSPLRLRDDAQRLAYDGCETPDGELYSYRTVMLALKGLMEQHEVGPKALD